MGVVVVAAGSGTRLGAERPKAFVEVVGTTILERAVAGVLEAAVDELVVVVPEDLVAEATGRVDPLRPEGVDVTVVAGGAERTDSVAAGLAALSDAVSVVLVHDAARCLTPVVVFERVLAALAAGAAGAIPGVPVVDTIKVVDAGGVITATPLRDSLRAVQTPQGFDRALLTAAHASGAAATDDAALVEALGHDVIVVEGDALGLKITTVDDLARAERLLSDH
ncbi:2-C-methyl-D-erythritol 4-phosphate cytidylyltransferase [Janibacter indicus]|uniref:2-C-methyl-D-erythritol 4-phosphate cytidylyltransferase n=1 Tax=Janibacter indicus TaxID=857417 RepID=A0A1L3MDA0_9MICO|nr:2-C-methyl-D-erythritol 4-phosphate cytidylyltransferase [Janibacter indicus]APH00381.1 2-C-methyl-D-erythritol 4-phosphate cytidylyltransferase [Janibacter indicus]